jgi:hypothetical protein
MARRKPCGAEASSATGPVSEDEGIFRAGVDLKRCPYSETEADELEILDLRRWDAC